MAFSAGTKLGPYEIVGLLGKGGMGEGYRARDAKLKREVAIKVLPDGFSHQAEQRFQREAEVLASLNHPRIAAIYDLADFGKSRFLVLELVEGDTLADRVARGPIPLNESLVIASQVAEALEAAHEKGITHRDLKPANIKITPDGNVKVLDFGLAKVTDDAVRGDLSVTVTIGGSRELVILGTPAYMSPEQATGKPLDKRTDIWAFGCVFYEVLTGRNAFAGKTVSHTIAAIFDREPDWSALPETTPSTIRRLLQRCLEKDGKRRLHDIADARIEIDDILREPAASGVQIGSMEGARRAPAAPRKVWALAAGALLLVTLGVVAGVMWWPARVTSPRSSLARVMITLPASQVLEKGRSRP